MITKEQLSFSFDTSHLKWTPVPDYPSTIDENVTEEDIQKAIDLHRSKCKERYDAYRDLLDSL